MLIAKNLSILPGPPFRAGSNLLVDTCVWLAVSDDTDGWHGPMSDLFNRYILTSDGPVLYYTDYIKGEFLNRVESDWRPKPDDASGRSAKVVAREWWDRWSVKAAGAIRPIACVLPTTDFIQDLERRLSAELELGNTDALIVAHACYYNVPLLTVDSTTIVQKLTAQSGWFRDVGLNLTVFYRTPQNAKVRPGIGTLPTPKAAVDSPAD